MSNPEKLPISSPSPEKGAPSPEEHIDLPEEEDRVSPEEVMPLPEQDMEIESGLAERVVAAIREIKKQHAEKIVEKCLYGAIALESLAVSAAVVTNYMILKEFADKIADKLAGYETVITSPSHAVRAAIVTTAIATTAGSIIGPAFIKYLNRKRQKPHG